MKGRVLAIWLVAAGVGGLCAGRSLATAGNCSVARSSALDRHPAGPQSSHECHYGFVCSCGSRTGAAGWHRTDTCAKCPIQVAETQARECQSEFACKLSDRLYGLCRSECGP